MAIACTSTTSAKEDPRTTNVFLVRSAITVQASSHQEASSRISAYHRWLHDLSIHGARGTRFLNPWGKILEDPNGTEFSSAERASEESTNWMADSAFDIFAEDESLARARFLGLTNWLAKIAETRSIEVSYVGSPSLALPNSVELDRSMAEPSDDYSWLYPRADCWFDLDDQGESNERDVREAIALDALDAFLIHTDEEREALDSLQQAAVHLHRVEADIYAWKWVIISLHNALQAFMVLALQGTNPVRVTGKDGKLLQFFTLYDRIKKDKYMGMLTISKSFKPNGTQTGHVKKLSGLRDSFIHFDPKGWSLAVEMFPLMAHDCADVIRFLLEDSGNISWAGDYSRGEKAKAAVQDVLVESTRLSNVYADKAKAFMKPGKHHAFRVGGVKGTR